MFRSTGYGIALAGALSLLCLVRADAGYHSSDIDLFGAFEEPHDIVAESHLYCLALAKAKSEAFDF